MGLTGFDSIEIYKVFESCLDKARKKIQQK